MILLLKIFCMFVVRTQLLIYGANSTEHTETILRGRRTDESAAVSSLLSNDWVRSDLPYLFYSKSFYMRTQNDELDNNCPNDAAAHPLTIEQILKEFFFQNTLQGHQDDLWLMFSAALGSADLDDWSATDRSNLAFFYKQLSLLFSNLEKVHLKPQICGLPDAKSEDNSI